MSVTIRFNADASGVKSALAGVTGQIDGLKEEMAGLSCPDFAMGAEAVIGLLGRAAGAARGLFEAVVAPAAEMEQYMARFETVLGSAAYMQQLTTPPHRDRRRGEVRRSDCQAPLPHHARARQPHREARPPLHPQRHPLPPFFCAR